MFKNRGINSDYISAHSSENGFSRMVIISVLLHAITLSLAVFFTRPPHLKLFYTPMYTVNLVDTPQPKRKIHKKRTHPIKKPIVKKVTVTKKPAVAKKVVDKKIRAKTATLKHPESKKKEVVINKVKKRAKPLPKRKADNKKAGISLNNALKRIRERVKKREEDSMLDTSIDRLKSRLAKKETLKKKKIALNRIDLRRIARTPASMKGAAQRRIFEVKFKEYYQTVKERIGSNWFYPGTETGGDFVVVGIRIDDSGGITKKWLERSSADPQLNRSALKAIEVATMDKPFPPPPAGMDRDIAIRFCSEGCPE